MRCSDADEYTADEEQSLADAVAAPCGAARAALAAVAAFVNFDLEVNVIMMVVIVSGGDDDDDGGDCEWWW